MSVPSWLTKWRRAFRTPTPARRAALRPQVELLEHRLAPAVITWAGSGTGAGSNWSVGSNWVGGVAPGPNDIAQFDPSVAGAANTNSTINAGFGGSVQGVVIADDYTATITDSRGTFNVGTAGFSMDGGTFLLGAHTMQVAGDLEITDGTFSAASGTVVFNGGRGVTQTLTSDGATFGNLTYNGAGILQQGDDLTVGGSFSSNSGTYKQGANDLTVAGNFTILNATTFVKATGMGNELTFSGTGTLNDFHRAGSKQDLGAVVAGGGTRSLKTPLRASSLTTDSGATFVLNGHSLTLTTAGAVANSGTFMLNGSEGLTNVTNLGTTAGTVVYVGRGDDKPVTLNRFGGAGYFNLTVSDSKGASSAFKVPSPSLLVNGTLTLTRGKLDTQSHDLTVAGNWKQTGGTFVPRSGTVIFNGSSAQTIQAIDAFHALTMSGGTKTALSNFTADGRLSLGGGTNFALADHAVGVGSLTGTGTIDWGTGTIANVFTVGGDGTSTTFAGQFANGTEADTLHKTGSGTLTVTNAANSFAGKTQVGNGTLQVDGSLTGDGITVSGPGSVLTGMGAVGDITANNGGTVKPGTPLGILAATSADFRNGGVIQIRVKGFDNTTTTEYSQLQLSDTLTVDGTSILKLDVQGLPINPDGTALGVVTYAEESGSFAVGNVVVINNNSTKPFGGFGVFNDTALDAILDNVLPTSTLTFPVAGAFYESTTWTGSITGTADDDLSGVRSVAVSIRRDSTGKYWNGTSFGSNSPVFLTASGTDDWSLAFALNKFPARGSYSVQVRATDNAGNVATSNRTTFTVDPTV